MMLMSNIGIGWRICLLSALILVLNGCTTNPTPEKTSQDMVENAADPTPADNLPELVANLSSEDPRVRFVSAYALEQYGKEAEIAIPALIDNLNYGGYSDVRRSAAVALGKLGPAAREGVPELMTVVQDAQEAVAVRVDAIDALGKIGEESAVPALVTLLFDDKDNKHSTDELMLFSARSIAKITGEKFTDSDTQSFVYGANAEGIPLIVLDARKWWEEEGQFIDWNGKQ